MVANGTISVNGTMSSIVNKLLRNILVPTKVVELYNGLREKVDITEYVCDTGITEAVVQMQFVPKKLKKIFFFTFLIY